MNTVRRLGWGLCFLILIVVPVAVLAQSQGQPPSAPRSLTGDLAVIWGDPLPGTPGGPIFHYYLTDDQGVSHKVVLADVSGITDVEMVALDGERLTMTVAADGRLLSRPDLIAAPRLRRSPVRHAPTG